jgi:hypothetical protein
MVFNIKPLADKTTKRSQRWSIKPVIKVHQSSLILASCRLTLWKNTDTLKQGYVTGIEPGTSYAYPVTIEREQKRVKQLQPGASTQFDLTYTLLSNPHQVKDVENRIASIQGETKQKSCHASGEGIS